MWFLKSNLNIGQVMPPALEALCAQETGHVARGLKGAHGGAISLSAAFCAGHRISKHVLLNVFYQAYFRPIFEA